MQRRGGCGLQEVAAAIDCQPTPRLEAPGHEHRHWAHQGLCPRPPLMRGGAAGPTRNRGCEDAHGTWVDVDDLNDREVKGVMKSVVHYNRPEGYVVLGQRFARQGHALIKGKGRRKTAGRRATESATRINVGASAQDAAVCQLRPHTGESGICPPHCLPISRST